VAQALCAHGQVSAAELPSKAAGGGGE